MRKRKQGLTLVEVVISMAIILMVGVACIQVLQFNSRVSLSTLKRIQATHYLEQISNHLHRSNPADLKDYYAQFPQIITDNTYTAEVTIQKPAEDQSRQATIAVHWSINRSQNSVSMRVTLVPT